MSMIILCEYTENICIENTRAPYPHTFIIICSKIQISFRFFYSIYIYRIKMLVRFCFTDHNTKWRKANSDNSHTHAITEFPPPVFHHYYFTGKAHKVQNTNKFEKATTHTYKNNRNTQIERRRSALHCNNSKDNNNNNNSKFLQKDREIHKTLCS